MKTNRFQLVQEIVFEELHNYENEMESPSIRLGSLNLYLYKLGQALDLRERGLSTKSGSIELLPEFPKVFDKYGE